MNFTSDLDHQKSKEFYYLSMNYHPRELFETKQKIKILIRNISLSIDIFTREEIVEVRDVVGDCFSPINSCFILFVGNKI